MPRERGARLAPGVRPTGRTRRRKSAASGRALPDVRFHDLRHTCATLLLTRGVHPKIVSEVLGHSSIAITLDIYSHVVPRLGDVATSAMEDALGE